MVCVCVLLFGGRTLRSPVFRTLVIAEAMCSASAASRLKSQTCRRNVTSAGCGGAAVGPGAVDVAAPAPSPAGAGPRFKPQQSFRASGVGRWGWAFSIANNTFKWNRMRRSPR